MPSSSSSSDERALQHEWVRRVAEGDSGAYRALCERYMEPLHRFAQRLLSSPSEAEDVVQETFLRVWQHAPRYQPTATVSTWIYRIARNLCLDRLRRRRETDERISLLEGETGPGQLLDRKELSHQVQAALSELPERQRSALLLVHFEGLSQQEAAAVLEVGVQALESLLARGRRTLRKQLEAYRTPGGDR